MFKEYLKKYRLSKNLTQTEFAKLLDTHQTYYSMIESGFRKPGINFINKLAKVMEVDPSMLRKLL